MSTPIPTHRPAQPQPADAAVPLAVWPLPRRSTTEPIGLSQLLHRLVAEYAPAERHVLLCEPARHRLEMQIIALPTGHRSADDGPGCSNAQAGPGLLIALLDTRVPRPEELTLLAAVAAGVLRPCGLLVIITRSRPSRLRRHQDQVSRSVHAAAAAGFGYLQHVIIVEPEKPDSGSGDLQDTRNDAERDAATPHRTTHLDVTIFRRPAAPVAASPAIVGAAE
jgi:hypothetical protein